MLRARMLATTLVLAVGGWLVWFTLHTEWVMDADEAVHAVEALRLHDDLARADAAAFLRDTYFPEVWHPEVDPHVRWYPFVHAWALLPSFALFGPSDFSARLPSIVFLVGTCAVFFELARRLARERGELCGLLAVLLLLTAPNLLTFAVQSLIALAALFTCSLALLAYLWSLEREHPPGRAVLAGLALAVAMLTKYDHGGILALALGGAELLRARFDPRRFVRSGAFRLLLVAGLPVALWFAHPAKLAALADSAAHPFSGSPRVIAQDLVVTWWTEYSSSAVLGLLAPLALLTFARRLSEPGPRAVWLWGAGSLVFYALRARYHFRYNIVEAPILLLLLATELPCWVRAAAEGLPRWRPAGVAGGAACLVLGLWAVRDPAGALASLEAPFRWFYGLRADHWGMKLEPAAYVAHYVEGMQALGRHAGLSLVGLGLAGLLVAALAGRVCGAGATGGRERLAWAALGLAAVPSTLAMAQRLPRMIESELEGHPELRQVHDFVREHAPAGTTVLLAGGWDQLPNNAVRWYRAIDGGERLERVPVVGDMIGSQVFPPGPRIAHWAERLAVGGAERLPERLLLLQPGARFLYRARFGPEAVLYERLARERGAYAELARASFPALGLEARMLERRWSPPPLAAERLPAASELERRQWVGKGGWAMGDEALRHFSIWRTRRFSSRPGVSARLDPAQRSDPGPARAP